MYVKKIIIASILCFPLLMGWSSMTNDDDKKEAVKKEKSLKAFEVVMDVITSPRCINCHPTDDYPRQTDAQIQHLFGVERGSDDHGLAVLKCNSCHHEENNPYSNIPGAPHWGLAPKSMGWLGLSRTEIGQVLVDSTKNGGRTPEALVKHMSEDALVLWAWEPGENRTVPPVPFKEFKKALKTWLDNGAFVPK